MRRTQLVAIVLTGIALVVRLVSAQPPIGRVLIEHTFTESADGWRISGDTDEGNPIFSPTGGHPGGCITGVDQALGETWFFHAPATVLQQLAAARGGSLSYSLKQSGLFVSLIDDDIVIDGPAGRLSYRFPNGPGLTWTDFSVRLTEDAGWRWNWNQHATQAQIDSVLEQPWRLEIRGEFVTGEDEGSLDNFVLRAAPGR
jgi:hypothetical protein